MPSANDHKLALEMLTVFADAELMETDLSNKEPRDTGWGSVSISTNLSAYRVGGMGTARLTYGDGAYRFVLASVGGNNNGYSFTILESDLTEAKVIEYISYHQRSRAMRNNAMAEARRREDANRLADSSD